MVHFPPPKSYFIVVLKKELYSELVEGFFIFSPLVLSEHFFYYIKPWVLTKDFRLFPLKSTRKSLWFLHNNTQHLSCVYLLPQNLSL